MIPCAYLNHVGLRVKALKDKRDREETVREWEQVSDRQKQTEPGRQWQTGRDRQTDAYRQRVTHRARQTETHKQRVTDE